jgi:hypothetical protein
MGNRRKTAKVGGGLEKDPHEEVTKEWKKEMERLEKRLVCGHKRIFWDATGNVGICVSCGATIKRAGSLLVVRG